MSLTVTMSSTSAILTSVMMNEHAPAILRSVSEGRLGKTVVLRIVGDEGEERLTLTREEYETLGAPAVGAALDEGDLTAARQMSDYHAAFATALHILERGDTTRAQLRGKLLLRGHTPENTARVVQEMVKHGYIDESRLAARQVVLCAKKGWGRRRIIAYLASRGISADAVSEAIATAEGAGEIDFAAARRAFIETRRARGMSDAAIQRALWNAGF